MGIADHKGTGTVDWIHLDGVMTRVREAICKAIEKHAPMHSPHEGHSVIREECEELWEHIKADTGRTAEAEKEAIHIAAMAIRYILDLCAQK